MHTDDCETQSDHRLVFLDEVEKIYNDLEIKMFPVLDNDELPMINIP